MQSITKKKALEYHRRGKKGKIEVVPTKPCITQMDLSLAYTPGVAEPCREIEKNPANAYHYTAKGNLVAVISNGTAVLGLGNIGALAGKPVMEGKGVLFKRFADVDVFDIEIDTEDPLEIIRFCKLLEPTFGGINLEDIKAPDCFLIEETLKKEMAIPVFHDDQHGTAIISGAALLNAIEVVNKDISKVRVVYSGAGAAGIACAKFYISLGVDPANMLMIDSKGVIYSGREDMDSGHPRYNKYKADFAIKTDARTLDDAMVDADIFCGVSVADMVTKDMVKTMAENPIIFAMANPDPEITYPDAKDARSDVIMATGRSDYPNQVNNVLGFPFIFRGALDVRSRAINEDMKIAAAKALAELAKEDVPDSVCRAYGVERFAFSREYLIPKPFDPRVLIWESVAVAKAACDSGVAGREITDWEEYKVELEARLGPVQQFTRSMITRARTDIKKKLVFAEGDHPTILRAAQLVIQEDIAKPILLGPIDKIKAKIEKLGLDHLSGVEIVNPLISGKRKAYAESFYSIRKRKGLIYQEAYRLMARRHYYAPVMVLKGDADAMLAGINRHYPDVIRPALHVVGPALHVDRVCGMNAMLFKDKILLFADTTVHMDPTAEELVAIAEATVEVARNLLHMEPRIAMLSFSNFGSVRHRSADKVAKATKLLKEKRPDLIIDGEMQADIAVSGMTADTYYPFAKLKGDANILIFPELNSANISYKLLRHLGDVEVIGPILAGTKLPIHILEMDSSAEEVVSMAALAAVDAEVNRR